MDIYDCGTTEVPRGYGLALSWVGIPFMSEEKKGVRGEGERR